MLLIWWNWNAIKPKGPVLVKSSAAAPAPAPAPWLGWISPPYFLADQRLVTTTAADGVPALTLTLDSWLQFVLQSILSDALGLLNPARFSTTPTHDLAGLQATWKQTVTDRIEAYPGTGVGVDRDALAAVYASKQADLMRRINVGGVTIPGNVLVTVYPPNTSLWDAWASMQQ